ncbi:MAG: hypothetical protein QOH18_1762, partial [Solirubrobacterales bacterium]|nr:hypothetical protein [Solirubrobacterales bacterium]
GAATTFGQTAQPFKITYTDGTTATVNISLSSWTVSLGYPGETMVALTAYYNNGGGGRVTTSQAALYGYQIALDSTKIVKSITLPNNRNVVIVAMSLSTSSTPVAVAGSYVYTPPAGTGPAVGTVPLSVVFTPTDVNYLAATKTVNLIVNKALLTVTANNQTIAFGGSLSPYTASFTGFVNGDASSVVTGAASLSTIPATPTAAGTYPITAAQGTLTASNYSFTFVPGTLAITKINPALTWANPVGIVYGTALSSTQLNATASVPGTFTYTPALGSIPAAGTNILSVTFKPTDATDYNTVTQTVQIVVGQATPLITWGTPSSMTYGTALSALQLNATSTVVGTFVYTPAAGTVPAAGTGTLSVTFTPTDAGDYTSVTKTVSLTVNQATPVVTWTPPTAITYGTALSSTQLNASASVPGSFAYTPAVGNVPTGGTNTLSVIFTPTDTTNYTTVTKTVQLTVNKAIPLATWAPPAAITYGTALSATQLNARASVPGGFAYTPAAGAVLNAGTQTLSVTFTPTDTTNYIVVTQTVSLIVNKATLTVAAANANRFYNTANPTFTGTVTGGVNGDSFTESFTTTAILSSPVGAYPITPTTAGANLANYTVVINTGTLTVTQATPVVTWNNPASITYGTALSATQLNATASVPGAFVYTPAAGVVLNAGTQTLSVTFTPTDTTNYKSVTQTVQIIINQATLTVTAANASRIYNTPNPTFTGTVTGAANGDTFTESFTTAAVLSSPAGTYTIVPTAAGVNLGNYTVATTNGTLTITQATPVVTWNNPASITYGTAPSATQLNATASVPGGFAYTPAAGVVHNAGTQTLYRKSDR